MAANNTHTRHVYKYFVHLSSTFSFQYKMEKNDIKLKVKYNLPKPHTRPRAHRESEREVIGSCKTAEHENQNCPSSFSLRLENFLLGN